jgi:16S rRNA (guanine527-N7)-methyltransferase
MATNLMTSDRDEFLRWLTENHPALPGSAAAALLRYAELVVESSDRLGLVASGDRGRVYTRHVRESLARPLLESVPHGARVLDVGSGGGFPAIPLAIVREDLHLTLTEPRRKKAAFLERVVLTLGLSQVRLFAGTLEDLGRQTTHPAWECAVARGVRWTAPMIRGLSALLPEEATVIRYGPAGGSPEGVRVFPLGASDRAIQVWPRSRWEALPGTP